MAQRKDQQALGCLVKGGPKFREFIIKTKVLDDYEKLHAAHGALLQDIAKAGVYATEIRVLKEIMTSNRQVVTDEHRYKLDQQAPVEGEAPAPAKVLPAGPFGQPLALVK